MEDLCEAIKSEKRIGNLKKLVSKLNALLSPDDRITVYSGYKLSEIETLRGVMLKRCSILRQKSPKRSSPKKISPKKRGRPTKPVLETKITVDAVLSMTTLKDLKEAGKALGIPRLSSYNSALKEELRALIITMIGSKSPLKASPRKAPGSDYKVPNYQKLFDNFEAERIDYNHLFEEVMKILNMGEQIINDQFRDLYRGRRNQKEVLYKVVDLDQFGENGFKWECIISEIAGKIGAGPKILMKAICHFRGEPKFGIICMEKHDLLVRDNDPNAEFEGSEYEKVRDMLDLLHKHGIVHRDVVIENIAVSKNKFLMINYQFALIFPPGKVPTILQYNDTFLPMMMGFHYQYEKNLTEKEMGLYRDYVDTDPVDRELAAAKYFPDYMLKTLGVNGAYKYFDFMSATADGEVARILIQHAKRLNILRTDEDEDVYIGSGENDNKNDDGNDGGDKPPSPKKSSDRKVSPKKSSDDISSETRYIIDEVIEMTTLKDLKNMAKSLGIPGFSSYNSSSKEDLRDLILKKLYSAPLERKSPQMASPQKSVQKESKSLGDSDEEKIFEKYIIDEQDLPNDGIKSDLGLENYRRNEYGTYYWGKDGKILYCNNAISEFGAIGFKWNCIIAEQAALIGAGPKIVMKRIYNDPLISYGIIGMKNCMPLPKNVKHTAYPEIKELIDRLHQHGIAHRDINSDTIMKVGKKYVIANYQTALLFPRGKLPDILKFEDYAIAAKLLNMIKQFEEDLRGDDLILFKASLQTIKERSHRSAAENFPDYMLRTMGAGHAFRYFQYFKPSDSKEIAKILIRRAEELAIPISESDEYILSL